VSHKKVDPKTNNYNSVKTCQFCVNFRHNNRTSRQEGCLISLEKHATTSMLLTSEMHRWKFEVNIADNQWSVTNSFVYCFTAYAQRVLLLVECMTSGVDASGWSPSHWSSGQTSATLNQTCFEVTDVTNECAIHSLLQYAPHVIVHSTGFRSGLFGGHNHGGM